MNGMTIAFWVLFALWAILLFSRFRKEAPKGANHVHDITFDALILAILCVMAFVRLHHDRAGRIVDFDAFACSHWRLSKGLEAGLALWHRLRGYLLDSGLDQPRWLQCLLHLSLD